MGKQWQTLFFEAPKSLQMVTAAMKLKDARSLEENLTNLDSMLKSRHYFAKRGPSGISSSHVWMWELDCEEGWLPKNWCFWTVVLEKTLESPLDCEEIQPVHSKGDEPWVFFGRNDAKAEAPVLWPPHAKCWLIGKDWCWQGLGTGGEGDDRGWDGWLASPTQWTWVWVNSGSGEGQGGQACCGSWGCKESDMTEWLNWTELNRQES